MKKFITDKLIQLKDKIKQGHAYLKAHKKTKWLVYIGIVLAIFMLVKHHQGVVKQNAQDAKIDQQAQKALTSDDDSSNSDDSNSDNNGKPQSVVDFDSNQKDLIQHYGQPKKGYAWDSDGNLVAMGNPDMKPQDVARIYLQSASKLDAQQMEKYAYPSAIVNNLNKYYNSDSDYSDSSNFKLNVYKTVLKSLQITGTVDEVPYANNKMVITYNAKFIDLSYKDFWKKDQDKLFKNMLNTMQQEHDQNKVNDYLYQYCYNYYQGHPSYRTTQLTVVLQKSDYAGWIVTNDNAIDNIGKYDDNDLDNSPIAMIQNDYETWSNNQPNSKSGSTKSNINDSFDDSTGKSNKYSGNNYNGNKDLQGSTGSNQSSPFAE